MRQSHVGAIAVAILALGAVSACKDTTSSGLGTVTCAAADAALCPPSELEVGWTGATGTPTIVPGNASTDVTVTTSAYNVTGTTNASTSGFWLLVSDGNLTSWGVLTLTTGGVFTGTVPLVCGAQTLIYRFTNSAGTSYYVVDIDRQGCAGPSAFRVQLTWTSDPNSDLDLHLLRPGGAMFSTTDCYFSNCKAAYTSNLGLEWGATGAAGNPVLDVDDTDGYGPENIYLTTGAESGQYRIIIHDWDGTVGEIATVRVYFNDVEAARYVSAGMNGSDHQYWEVAKVDVVNRTITPVLTYSSSQPVTLHVAPAWAPTVK